MNKSDNRYHLLNICFIVILSLLYVSVRGIHTHGDGASYYLMAESLLHDGDLLVNKTDMERWDKSEFGRGPRGTYLQIGHDGELKYSKPILFSLLAVPFLCFGINGLVLMNAFLLAGGIIFPYLFLRKKNPDLTAMLISFLFFFASFMPEYSSWTTPETMYYFACSLSLWLLLGRNNAFLAALVIGIVASAKLVFLLLLIPLIAVKVHKGKIKELFRAVFICVTALSVMSALTLVLSGSMNTYAGNRGYIPVDYLPYQSLEKIKDSLVIAQSQFEGFDYYSVELFLRNVVSFFIGRFGGIAWQAFPAVVCSGLYVFYRRRLSREERITGDSIMASASALLLILIISKPLNYFGGPGFVGNRYFFILPALLFLPAINALKRPEYVILMFLPGLLISSQILINKNEKYFSKTYPIIFPLKHAPLEIPQVEFCGIGSMPLAADTRIYAPLGIKKRFSQGIVLDKGQEFVFVQENGNGTLQLNSEQGEIDLKPNLVLINKRTKEKKIFYYFKSNKTIMLNIPGV